MSKSRHRNNRIHQACCMLMVLAMVLAFGMSQACCVLADTGSCPSGRDGEHDWKVTVTQRATETQDGQRTFECRNCGESYTEGIPATGHTWGKWKVTKEPTCTEKGEKERTCTKQPELGHSETKAIAAKGHDLKKTEAKAATETKDGNIAYYKCSECGKYFLDSKGKKETTKADTVIPATGKKSEDKKSGDKKSDTSGDSKKESTGTSSVTPAIPGLRPEIRPSGLTADAPFTPVIKDKKQAEKKESAVKKEKDSERDVFAYGSDSVTPVEVENAPVPLGAADVAIAGANGIALIYFAILLLPLFRVWFWIMKKRREAEEDQ